MDVSSLVADLQASLEESKIVLPGCSEYEQALKRWAASIQKPAGVVVFPTTSEDVSIALQLAAKHSVPFTSVCGGHGTSGDSSTDGGLLLNLRRLNSVSVDTANLIVTCGGGSIWAEVDVAAEAHHLSLVSGTVNQTGVAGYTTGGGFGWLSGRYGLAIDNLLSAEVVLADGRIITCSSTQEPDLFWAIRGAGHMFGIITSFTFRAHPQPNQVYGGMVIFPPLPAAIEHLITFANSIQASSDGRTAMFCGFTTPPATPGKRAIFGCCFHDGPEEEGRKLFAPLVENSPIPPKTMLKSMSHAAMNEVLALAAASEGRRVSKGACYDGPLPPSVFQKLLNMYEDFVANECPEAGESGACLFEFYPLDAVASVPSNATAFVNRAKHNNAMIIPRWRSAKYDSIVRKFAKEAMETLKREANKKSGETGEYLNYDGLGTGPEKVFGTNYPRLQLLKERYDPGNAFSKVAGLKPRTNLGIQTLEAEQLKADVVVPLPSPPSSATSPTLPPTPDHAVTHEISINTIGESNWNKTQGNPEEVQSVTAKLLGVNVAVIAMPLNEEMHSD